MGHINCYLFSIFLMLYRSPFVLAPVRRHFHVESLWRVRKGTYKRFVRLLKQITRIFMAIAFLRLKRRTSTVVAVVVTDISLFLAMCSNLLSFFSASRSLVRIDKRKKLSSSFQPLVFSNSKTYIDPLTFPSEFLLFLSNESVNPVCLHSFPTRYILFQPFIRAETVKDFCRNRKCILIVSHNNNIRCYTQ